jgi:hypothetical protein
MHLLATLVLLALLVHPDGLSEAEFARLRPELQIKGKPWATLPWQVSTGKARELARQTKKPIFMIVDTGSPIGCA